MNGLKQSSNAAPPVAERESQRAHFHFQEGRRSKGGSKRPLAAPPVGQAYAVRSPDGIVIPASAYDWRRGDILFPAQGAA